jgi:hypothetical protein
VAVRLFLKGIENVPTYQAKNGLVTDVCLESLPEDDIFQVGYKALSLLSPAENQIKNSDSPLPLASAPETLAAVE